MPRFRLILWVSCFLLVLFNGYRALSKNWNGADPMDFRGLYVQTLLFSEGEELYSDEIAADKWNALKTKEGFESSSDLGDKFYSIMLYPPQVVVQFYFFKDLSWTQVRIFWWFICSISFLLILILLYHFHKDPLIIGLALAAKASFFALSLGQPLLPVMACILLSLSIYEKRPWLAGFLLGLALLKFTLVIPIAFWLLFRKKLKVFGAMACTGLLLLAPAIIDNPDVIAQFFAKVTDYYAFIYTPHPLNIYTFSNSELTMMIDYYLDQPAAVWNRINLLAQLSCYLLFGWMYVKKKLSESVLLALFILNSFVFSYHLSYDALFLLIPLATLTVYPKWYTFGMIWFLILALPWNYLMKAINPETSFSLPLFNYPIMLLIAFAGLIFANFGKRTAHITP